MKSITQEHPMGCAVACVAFVTSLTYSDALKLFSNKENAWLRGYYCREIVAALVKLNIKAQYFHIKPSKRRLVYEPNTIAFVQRSKKYPFGHFLVRTDDRL